MYVSVWTFHVMGISSNTEHRISHRLPMQCFLSYKRCYVFWRILQMLFINTHVLINMLFGAYECVITSLCRYPSSKECYLWMDLSRMWARFSPAQTSCLTESAVLFLTDLVRMCGCFYLFVLGLGLSLEHRGTESLASYTIISKNSLESITAALMSHNHTILVDSWDLQYESWERSSVWELREVFSMRAERENDEITLAIHVKQRPSALRALITPANTDSRGNRVYVMLSFFFCFYCFCLLTKNILNSNDVFNSVWWFNGIKSNLQRFPIPNICKAWSPSSGYTSPNSMIAIHSFVFLKH